MERDDDKARTAEEAAAEKAMNKHPASPEQTGVRGFAEGYEHVPGTPEEELDEQREPNFARGISHEDTPGTEHHGRFSEGEETLPDSPDDTVERRFSEGSEESPTSE